MSSIKLTSGSAAAWLLVSSFSAGQTPIPPNTAPVHAAPGTVLFDDSMRDQWQENWFLDGKRAVLGHTEEGLWIFCTPSGVDKLMDREKFDAHHSVLWTKQVFEGDIRITYDFAKKGTSLLYIQAQGIGTSPYEKDIFAWRNLREVSSMEKYFDFMTLRSLSFRENIRFKRYPWKNPFTGKDYENLYVKPIIEYDGEHGNVNVEQFCHVLVESKKDSLRLRIVDAKHPINVIEHTWNANADADPHQPVFTRKGRIGLRNMGGCWARYANVRVIQL